MTRHELADAMLRGKNTPSVREDKLAPYVSVSPIGKYCRACALGCALIGKFNGDYETAEAYYDAGNMTRDTDEDFYSLFARLLDIDSTLAFEVELLHLNNAPIEDIAKWLKSSEGGEA